MEASTSMFASSCCKRERFAFWVGKCLFPSLGHSIFISVFESLLGYQLINLLHMTEIQHSTMFLFLWKDLATHGQAVVKPLLYLFYSRFLQISLTLCDTWLGGYAGIHK
jgi:hypothetical protein